ncbi:unnamed protein product [Spirodela intermedia]|uniref:RING-type domain-containing protein n=1 Tax=Spirodela intermedia TaxID=51605 RepID=A0A7I8JP12_SPIIN|nr:unnamed protein product [Spirodela intermedia]CAA6671937.1 unnamed protein product [Spirodela intermedia]
MEASPGQRVAEICGSGIGSCFRASKMVVFGGLTCTFAVGGAVVGVVSGALKGQTTETGLLRGASIGAVAGALVSVELLESLLREISSPRSLSTPSTITIAMFESLIDGKIFREWVSPAMLKAYQWQVSNVDDGGREASDVFDTAGATGMSPEAVRRLPELEVCSMSAVETLPEGTTCAVCLQDFKNGESAKRLPVCCHLYHAACIDEWLLRHRSCPLCRRNL